MSRRNGTQSLDDLWTQKKGIGSALHDIFNMNTTKFQGRYMETYTQIYNYCTATSEQHSNATTRQAGGRGRSSRNGPAGQSTQQNFVGTELYGRLKNEIQVRIER